MVLATLPARAPPTRALGAEPVLMADCFRQPLAEGDYLLLCSDGLSNVVNEQEINRLLAAGQHGYHGGTHAGTVRVMNRAVEYRLVGC